MTTDATPGALGSNDQLGAMAPTRATVWVCLACGKQAQDRYNGPGGWDESCMLNSAQCYVDALTYSGGRVSSVAEGGVIPEPPPTPRTPEQDAADHAELLAEAQKVVDHMEALRRQGNGAGNMWAALDGA